jgi:hypothetical protein
MQLASTSTPLFGNLVKKPPPLWYVTNGVSTVGPVTTNLLVRGVASDRVPNDCLVRERTWRMWRGLDRIREVAAVRREQAVRGAFDIEPTRWKEPEPLEVKYAPLLRELLAAQDPNDVLARALIETMRATGALVGAVHRRRPPHSGFVTTCVLGPGMRGRLGRAFAGDDPAFALAAEGSALCEAPRHGASGCVSEHLGGLAASSGVAMVPVTCLGRLYAVLELGRPDHEFRAADFQVATAVTGLVADHLCIVQNRAVSGS